MYQSGTWHGHWDQGGLGRQEMHDLHLKFDGNRLTGQGWDCVGRFTMDGEIMPDAEVHIVKCYVDDETDRRRHSVVYLGRHDGEGRIHGVWALEGDNGRWSIRMEGGFQKSDAPIEEMQP